MTTEEWPKYDPRRLLVLSRPHSTGIWHPVIEDKTGHTTMVRHDALHLPLKLSDDFNGWVRHMESLKFKDADDIFHKQHIARGQILSEELARFVEDQYQVEYNGKRILTGLDINPLSRAFIFSKRYASHRNKRDFRLPFNLTYLAALLKFEMTDDTRYKIFPGKFDLGNGQKIQAEALNYSKLAQELSQELPGGREVIANDNPFKAVKEGIERLTGYKLSGYMRKNPLTTFKVIKLLYNTLTSRHNRLFHFLKLPDSRRYTLEFRGVSFRKRRN